MALKDWNWFIELILLEVIWTVWNRIVHAEWSLRRARDKVSLLNG